MLPVDLEKFWADDELALVTTAFRRTRRRSRSVYA